MEREQKTQFLLADTKKPHLYFPARLGGTLKAGLDIEREKPANSESAPSGYEKTTMREEGLASLCKRRKKWGLVGAQRSSETGKGTGKKGKRKSMVA